MARRNLLAEAQVTAAAQVAPQVAALSEALRQARTDRNSAIHAAAAANAGIAHAIHLAGSSVKKGYTGAQALAAPAQSYSGGNYGQAASNERSLGTTALASSLGNALKELSDRRISAAGGRAYATARALSDYEGKVAGVQTKRQGLAAQQGLLTGSTLSKLTEAQAGRNFTAGQNALDRSATAQENATQRTFTHHEDALGRRSDRITAGINAKADAGKTAADQKFTAGENRKDRQLRVKLATADGGVKPTADATFKGRQAIQAWVDQYQSVGDMSKVYADAKKKNIPSPIILAAANLHDKGYIAPREVRGLELMGIAVPKEWTGVQIRPHTRRRRGK